MTALRDAIKNYLALDATLMALLPGGLYVGGEISRQDAPGAFDANGEVKACGLVALEVQTPFGPFADSARQFFTVTFWQQTGYTAIDAAIDRTFALLNEGKVGLNADAWTVLHAEDSADVEDPGLKVPMRYGRYQMIRARS
jgi:hypothetical protein